MADFMFRTVQTGAGLHYIENKKYACQNNDASQRKKCNLFQIVHRGGQFRMFDSCSGDLCRCLRRNRSDAGNTQQGGEKKIV